jgi:hypothetical protein
MAPSGWEGAPFLSKTAPFKVAFWGLSIVSSVKLYLRAMTERRKHGELTRRSCTSTSGSA